MINETVFESLSERLKIAPGQIALEAPGRAPATYSDLDRSILKVGLHLRGLGLNQDDRVVIVLPNGPEMAVTCLGVMSVSVAVPANPDFRKGEYETMFRQLAPRLLITLAEKEHPSREAARDLSIPVCEIHVLPSDPAGSFDLTPQGKDAFTAPTSTPAPDDLALILQTSGTTSRPKTVPLTHRNLFISARNMQKSVLLSENDRVLHFLPMFHIGGIVDVLMAPLLAGGTVITTPSFSTRDFFSHLERYRPTWTQAVPVMIHEILSDSRDFPELVAEHGMRFVRSVSAALPVPTLLEFERVFRIPVIEIFGMSESAGIITSNPLPPGLRKPGSVGTSAGCRVMILDDEKRPLPTGESGNVVVSGPSLMSGYIDDPEENARAITSAGFYTGDLGFLDPDGFLYLNGRVKDIINRGGEKITPLEIDRALMEYPSVADAACFPVPHPVLGEEVAALVVMKPGFGFVREDLFAFLRERLAFFKVPKIVEEVAAIPRSSGKLRRAELSEVLSSNASPEMTEIEHVSPATPVAKAIAAMWEKILRVQNIGLNDDFFLLGGDSLRASSFINELQQKWDETIYVSSLFDFSTVAGFETYLHRHYPGLESRILGSSLAPHLDESPRVTSAMINQLRSSIPRQAPEPPADLPRNPAAIFVLSTPRSGSTLLRAMLGGNPALFSPPELYLLSSDTLAERRDLYSGSLRFQLEGNLRALMELRQESVDEVRQFMVELEERNCSTREYYAILQSYLGDRMLVDKTPAYAMDVTTLQRAESGFESPFYIHLIRHPYGMIRSFEEAHLEQLWYPRIVGKESLKLDEPPYPRRQLAEMIWLIINENIIEFLRGIPEERQFKIRFEDLVYQPESRMRALCEKLQLPYDSGMINPKSDKKRLMTDGIHETSRMIGDPKFHLHDKIDPDVANLWKSAYTVDFLSSETVQFAGRQGYGEMLTDIHGREEFEL